MEKMKKNDGGQGNPGDGGRKNEMDFDSCVLCVKMKMKICH